jgi:hypothetical protein
MLWNSAAIVQHRELGQGFYEDMKSLTLSERCIPADSDATRWCPLV